ncbi:PTS sugar transporter subunit IIA, partial [Streptomyces rhizosphaericus]
SGAAVDSGAAVGGAGAVGVVGAAVGGSTGAASGAAEPVLAGVGGGERAGEASGAAGARKAVASQGVAAAETGEVEAVPEGQVLSGYLTEQTVKERLAADGKDAAIREMAELLATTGKVADAAELVRAAFAREDQGTTGLGEEIAIPHAKTDAVTAPVVGFARSPEGIEWGAPDGTKARLVFMIAVPEADAGDEHLRILALLSRKLMAEEFRVRLLAAGDVEGIL